MITTTKLPAGIVFPHTTKSGGEDLVRLIGGYSLSASCRTSKNIKRKRNEDTFINNRPKKELEMRMLTKTKNFYIKYLNYLCILIRVLYRGEGQPGILS